MRPLLALLAVSAALALEPLHVADGAFRTPDGTAVGLFGANLYQSHMMYARLQDPEPGLAELRAMAAHGFNFVRLPLSAGFIMPAEGVLPNHAPYAPTLAAHGLKPGYLPLLDRLLDECARLGLYALVEIHEYPRDPYRWFTGGEEKRRGTDQPGGGLDWMAAEGAVRRHTPAILGWLAARWRGRPELLGFEVPHNEPHGDAPEATGAGLKAFADDCCRAIKAADPGRLCVLAVGDWGAGVNRLDDSFVWDLPPGVDALTPHFYFGMHNNQSPLADAYGVAPASWLSWFRGSGKPVIVGEWGDAHVEYPRYQKFDDSDRLVQRLTDACLAGWLANGAQGVARWAWSGGIDDRERQQRLSPQAAAMLKYAAPYRQAPAGPAAVAVVLNPKRRAPYGGPHDLMRVAAALLDLGVAPFDAVFQAQVAAQPEVVRRYRAVLLYLPDLDPAVAQQARAGAAAVVELADDQVDRGALGRALAAAGVAVQPEPQPVWSFATPGRLALFNRSAAPATVTVPAAPGQRLVGRLSGQELAAAGQPMGLELPPFTGADLQHVAEGEAPDAVALVPPPAPPVAEQYTLYAHAGPLGRWVAGWGGGQAALGADEQGREVIVVTTEGVAQLGGFNLNRHQPVGLAPWLAAQDAVLRLSLRVTAGTPTRLQVRLSGEPADGLATVDLAPTGQWQTVDVPLSALRPAGSPATLTGVLVGLLPGGQVQVGGVWVVKVQP